MAGAERPHRCLFVRDVLSSAPSEAGAGQEAQVSVCGVVVELTRHKHLLDGNSKIVAVATKIMY